MGGIEVTKEWADEVTQNASRTWPQYTSIGGYTILYVDIKRDDCLCSVCAQEAFENKGVALVMATYNEGPDLSCFNCDASIESSYGDPDANENE